MKIRHLLSFLYLISITQISYGANLIEVFQDALATDPSFKAAEAERLATHENISIARSFLLPQLAGGAAALRHIADNRTESLFVGPLGTTDATHGTFHYGAYSLNLNASQSLLNIGAWQKLHEAKISAQAADATYIAATQDLIARVNQNYFAVLFAEDNLRFIKAQKQAIYQQLDQVQQEYKVGLVAITGLYQAKASYDLVLSEEIAAKNKIINAKENLRTITGKYYPTLAGLKHPLSLVKPNPANIQSWLRLANQHNWLLKAARLNAQAAKKQIDVQSAGHLPIVNAIASYGKERTGTSPQGDVNMQDISGGVALTLPIIEGGLVTAETRQARFNYEAALDRVEKTLRDTNNFTHQNFNNVIALISKIQADRQAIISNESALKSTSEGYRVGTETMLDVLQAVQKLTEAQKIFAKDQYAYIDAGIALKAAAGLLTIQDLQIINQWLGPDATPLDYLPTIPTHYQPTIPKPTPTNDKYLTQFTQNLHHNTVINKRKLATKSK